jgi:hypothetical protein
MAEKVLGTRYVMVLLSRNTGPNRRTKKLDMKVNNEERMQG